jgi:hypothetical protein
MFRLDLLVPEALGKMLGILYHFLRLQRELIKTHGSTLQIQLCDIFCISALERDFKHTVSK